MLKYTYRKYLFLNCPNSNSRGVRILRYMQASLIFNEKEHYPCSNESLLITQFDIQTLHEFLDSSITEDELKYLKTKEKQKAVKGKNGVIIKRSKEFYKHFKNVVTKEERNLAILNAYFDGYTQVDIAKHLKLSTSLISKVICGG